MNPAKTRLILDELFMERERQNCIFGEQNFPLVKKIDPKENHLRYGIIDEEHAKFRVDNNQELTYFNLLIEEVSEAVSAHDYQSMREELIQVGAVVVQMIEALDRNKQ